MLNSETAAMTPTELRTALQKIGWSIAEFCHQTDFREYQARRMLSGVAEIPEPIAQWLRRLAMAHAMTPCPGRDAK